MLRTVTALSMLAASVLGSSTLTEANLRARLGTMLDNLLASPAVTSAAAEHQASGSSVSAHDIARESLLCARFVKLDEPKIRVGPSSVCSGVGVFASTNIDEGELITCYPGDAVTYRLPPESPISEKQREDEGIRGVMWGRHVPQNLRKLTVANDEYAIKIDETYGGVGLRELDGDLAYVGHLINDGACLSNFGSASEYLKASKAAGNAGFRCLLGCHMITIATRSIPKGAEVLVSYGPDYWGNQRQRRVESISRVFSSFL